MNKLIGIAFAVMTVLGACVSSDDTAGDDEPMLYTCDELCPREAWCDNSTGLWTCGLPEDGGSVCDNPNKTCEIQ